MGYCMTQKNVDFTMSKNELPEALESVKALVEENPDKYAWVNSDEILRSETLEEALSGWGWELTFIDVGDVESIRFEREKSGDELTLFKTIAPFVEVNSFIEMIGEDGYLWRYHFDGKTCIEIEPEIEWNVERKRKCFNRCPNCNAPEADIEWGNKEWLEKEAYQEATCKKCGCEFREIYEYSQTIIENEK